MADRSDDLRMSRIGEWERFDALEGPEDGTDTHARLRELGWESFFTLGSADEVGIEVEVWIKSAGQGREYLVDVWGVNAGSEFLKVDSLPVLMELLAKWAPVVQAAGIARVTGDLTTGAIEHNGIVETVAARASWAKTGLLGKLAADRLRLDKNRQRTHRR